MTRQQITIPGPPEQLYIVRFGTDRTWWVVVEGDPTDRSWHNYLECQKLLKRRTTIGETYYTGGTGSEITEIREVPNTLIGFSGQPTAINVEVAPDDKADLTAEA